jgi:L-lactate dehydrogenase complex protein LldG
MSSREQILNAIKTNQPTLVPLPSLDVFANNDAPDVEHYINTLQGIGGKVIVVENGVAIADLLKAEFPAAERIISTVATLQISTELGWQQLNPNDLESVDLAIIKAQFGVAENGSIWVTETDTEVRVLPFICENLAAVLSKKNILNTMHQAYDTIANADYGFGVFIAGPSKTADIEQSLVLGAHGPKTMTIFLTD